jgi:hypothetical protein
MSGIFNADFYPTPPEVAATQHEHLLHPPFAMTTQTAYDGLTDDDWHLILTARPALGRWALRFAFSTFGGRAKERHAAWNGRGWVEGLWRPMPDSRTHAIAVAWLKANPVPVPGVAGGKP